VCAWQPTFDWIQPDLAVGGWFPIEHAQTLAREHGIGAVVDLRSESCDDRPALEACGHWFLHLPTPDLHGVSQPMLDEGVAFASRAEQAGRRLLVHCQHGIGRSAILALCILVDRGLAPMRALQIAKGARLKISPSQSQYEAWMQWIARRRPDLVRPTYHEFGCVAYQPVTQSA
jgi:hypothetical protein